MFLFVWKLKTVFFKILFFFSQFCSPSPTSIFWGKLARLKILKLCVVFRFQQLGLKSLKVGRGREEGGGRGRIDPLTIIDSHLPHNFAITFTPTPHTIFSTDSVLLFVRASDCRGIASDWLYRRWQQKGKYKILLIY